MKEDSLHSRVILVTGASSGLGKHAALAYAQRGATVLLLGRNETRLNAVYDHILTQGWPQAAVIPFDLAEANDPRFDALAQTVAQQMGRLDGILHSASHFVPLSPLAQQTLPHWKTAFATNVFAPFSLTRACLPMLAAAPDASVLFTAEQHGLNPSAYWGGFGVSQAALVALAKTFSEESGTLPNVRFNIVVPGPVASPMRNRTHPGELGLALRQPQELMESYCFWMGPESSGRSGEIIHP